MPNDGTGNLTATNITQPFLVLADAPYSPKRRKLLVTTLFLVNPTLVDLVNVEVNTGGFFSDDQMGLVEAKGKPKRFDRLEAGKALAIEQPSWDELYEYVIWWEVTYDGAEEPLRFSLVKGRDGVEIADVPVLGGPGQLIRLST